MKSAGDKAMGKTIREVFAFQSKSNPNGDGYQTLVYTDGSASCNCRGWIFNKKCWHIDEAQDLVARRFKGMIPSARVSVREAALRFPNLAGATMKAARKNDQPIKPVQTFVLERGTRILTLEDE